MPGGRGDGIRVGNPSVVVYDVAGRGFTRFRGAIGIENARAEIGTTLNPALRFYVFDAAPNPRAPAAADARRAAAPAGAAHDRDAAVDRVFRHAARPPADGRPNDRLAERRCAIRRAAAIGRRPKAWPICSGRC